MNPTQLCQWLVDLDDPDNRDERKQVTLRAIIRKAQTALDTEGDSDAVDAAARAHAAIQHARSNVTWDDLPEAEQQAMRAFVTPLVTAALGARANQTGGVK